MKQVGGGRGAAGGVPRGAQPEREREEVMALELRTACERCGADARPTAPRGDLLVRVHVLPGVRRGARARLPELRRRARPAAAPRRRADRDRRAAPLRPPAVLLVALRLLRLRHGRRPRAASTAATSRRCSRELELERALLAPQLETIYLGGGTPTFTEPARARAAARCAARRADEVTVEANPETVDARARRAAARATASTASRSARRRSTPRLLARARPRRAAGRRARVRSSLLRDAGFDNISLDLIYGIPGQSAADLERDLAEALALEPEHVSAYELEAKPGTRFTHAHGAELERQAEAMESYFELVVETLTGAGYRWYETANFCRVASEPAGATCARATTSATGSATTTSVSASAPSARSAAGAGATRRRSPRYLAALERGRARRRASSRSCRRRRATPSG